jgi:membrane fusion protein (multidrug efflux system)
MAGETVGEQWVVTGNIKAGDRVVAEGVQKVRDGSEVNPTQMAADTNEAPIVKMETGKP